MNAFSMINARLPNPTSPGHITLQQLEAYWAYCGFSQNSLLLRTKIEVLVVLVQVACQCRDGLEA